MALENKPEILAWNRDHGDNTQDSISKESSFEYVLDSACERLWDKQVKFSIRRIKDMEERLGILERELNELLGKQP